VAAGFNSMFNVRCSKFDVQIVSHPQRPRQHFGRGFSDAGAHCNRDLGRLQLAAFGQLGQDRGDLRLGGLGAAAVLVDAKDAELVVDRAIFHRFDGQMDVNRVAEAQRRGKFALGARARPAHQLAGLGINQVDPSGFEEVALRGLHIFKEIGEMHEPRHVGLGKFDASCGGMFICHAQTHAQTRTFGNTP